MRVLDVEESGLQPSATIFMNFNMPAPPFLVHGLGKDTVTYTDWP